MITKTNAVKMSQRKWKKVLEVAKRDVIDWMALKHFNRADCGFCCFDTTVNGYREGLESDCTPSCVLFPDICSSYGGSSIGEATLYWRIVGKIEERDPENFIPMIEQMIEAIDTRGKAWIGGK